MRLASEGKAHVKIAVNPAAIPAEKTAAQELAAYLGRMAGAKFEIVEEQDLPLGAMAVYVGDTASARGQGLDPTKLGAEEAVLRTTGKGLILTGGRPRGTLYAVYELLENVLGCRWYTPWAERVPSRATCTVPALDRRVKPVGHWGHIFDL